MTVASLTPVSVPSGPMETIESRLASIMDRESSTASFCSVRSRAMVDTPMTVPSASRTGEMVSETGNTVPSFRTRIEAKVSACWLAMTVARLASSSPVRSLGLSRLMDLPTISSLA